MNFTWIVLVSLLKLASAAGQKEKCSSSCCGSHGVPGVPGIPGFVGKDGRDGKPGDRGDVGPSGIAGAKDVPGEKGAAGADNSLFSNWKQCAWSREDGKDHALIQECIFNKKHSDSSLRIFYGGNLRIYNCNNCCKRWCFTISEAECKRPMAIDVVFFMNKGAGRAIYRHRHIEGYCNQIQKGIIRIGFWVGNCAGFGNADAHSGWNSVSRIMIEEVPPPQA